MNKHPLSLFNYCPKCGSSEFRVNNPKSKKCGQCGFTYYFNPSSATVAFIVNERNEILVCRRAKEPAKGTLDLPGGFVDLFESGEEGVIREVKEETGLTITIDPRPIDIYPATRGSDPMMVIVYQAKNVRGSVKLSKEHDEARWCTLAEFKTLCTFKPLVVAVEKGNIVVRT